MINVSCYDCVNLKEKDGHKYCRKISAQFGIFAIIETIDVKRDCVFYDDGYDPIMGWCDEKCEDD